MSRNKRHGNARPASGKIVLDSVAKAQIAKAMQQSFADRYSKDMYNTATVCMYLVTYMTDEVETLYDSLDGDNCPFAQKMRNCIGAIKRECDRFIEYFDPRVDESQKGNWISGYSQFQIGMANFFKQEYRYENEGERGKEICLAASLRPYDHSITDPQLIFEDGYRMGGAYADRHPAGTAMINENGIQTEMPLKQIVEEYARMKNPDAEITVEIKTNDD